MRIVMISDVHEHWHNLKIPSCDVLISTGDYSFMGKPDIVREYHQWLNKQPCRDRISLQGNHEMWVHDNWLRAKEIVQEINPEIIFTSGDMFTLAGRKFWCSSVTPEYGRWAWMKERGSSIRRHWDFIPTDTDILITHGPAYGILDTAHTDGEHLGCEELAQVINNLPVLKLHVFGHIHGGSGEKDIKGVHFVNASICDEAYKPVNPVRVFNL